MKVVILCGGFGTRLREQTEFIPKPMVEIGGRPILWHILKIYSFYGLNEFVLCLGYKGDIIRSYFLDYDLLNSDITLDLETRETHRHNRTHDEQKWRVTLAETGLSTMTGGRIRRVMRYIDGDTFLATYGDAVADVDIRKLLAFHERSGKLATLTAVQPPSRFGRLELDPKAELATGFTEKPLGGEAWVSGGFFVFNRRIQDYLDDDSSVLEQEPLMSLANERQLAVYRHSGYWQCMDTQREVETLQSLWSTSRPPWALWESRKPAIPVDKAGQTVDTNLA